MLRRLTNLRIRVRYLLFERQHHRSDRDAHAYPLLREYGGWTIRPARGWRSVRWITPPMHYTRAIPAADRDAACDWGMEKLGIV